MRSVSPAGSLGSAGGAVTPRKRKTDFAKVFRETRPDPRRLYEDDEPAEPEDLGEREAEEELEEEVFEPGQSPFAASSSAPRQAAKTKVSRLVRAEEAAEDELDEAMHIARGSRSLSRPRRPDIEVEDVRSVARVRPRLRQAEIETDHEEEGYVGEFGEDEEKEEEFDVRQARRSKFSAPSACPRITRVKVDLGYYVSCADESFTKPTGGTCSFRALSFERLNKDPTKPSLSLTMGVGQLPDVRMGLAKLMEKEAVFRKVTAKELGLAVEQHEVAEDGASAVIDLSPFRTDRLSRCVVKLKNASLRIQNGVFYGSKKDREACKNPQSLGLVLSITRHAQKEGSSDFSLDFPISCLPRLYAACDVLARSEGLLLSDDSNSV